MTRRIGHLLVGTGEAARRRGDDDEARTRLEEGLALVREVRDRRYIGLALEGLARLALAGGDLEAARTHAEECLALRRAIGNAPDVAEGLALLGRTTVRQGDLDAAHGFLREGLGIAREGQRPHEVLACLEGFAELATARGAVLQAARLWGATQTRRAALGTTLSGVDAAQQEQMIARARDQTDERAWDAAWDAGRQMTEDETVAYAIKK
jgi:tetratricopeptide (TPR) repeat protein